MPSILVLTKKLEKQKKNFVSLVQKNFKNQKTSKILLKKIANTYLSIDQGKIEVKIGQTDIRTFDVVYLRGIGGEGTTYMATTLAIAFEALGIKYFDTLYSKAGPHRSKLGSLTLLASNDLPIPKTVAFFDNLYTKHFEKISKELGIPFVAKEISQQKGKGVYLIKTISHLKKLPKTNNSGSVNSYFFQKYIEKDREYRLLVLGDEIGVWEEKVNNNKSEFRNNIALGASEVFFDAKKTPSEFKKVAVRASKSLGIQIGGADVITEKETGKVYLLEVNRGPGLTYDDKISPEFKALAKFLEKEGEIS